VKALRTTHTEENLSAKGGYVLVEPKGKRDVTLIGTGSEVMLAVEAAKALEGEGVNAAVVSMPCWELFEAQGKAYRNAVLGAPPRVGVEAAAEFGWSKWLRPDDAFIGVHGFGASAPAQDLYNHFGIMAEAVAAAAHGLIASSRSKGGHG
jgi:transketolase